MSSAPSATSAPSPKQLALVGGTERTLGLPHPRGCFTPPVVVSCKKAVFPDLPCKDAICTSVCFNDVVYVLFVLQSLSSLFHEIIRGKTHTALN